MNVISVGLWPMCASYFWRAYTRNKWGDWLLFGLLVGVNLLNTYVGALLLVALGVFVLSDKGCWKLLKNIKVYAAAAVALGVLFP